MPLTHTKELFAKALKGRYALGAFNVNNMELLQSIVEACAHHADSAVSQELLRWARKHGSARQLRSIRKGLGLGSVCAQPSADLTAREHQVLSLMAEGCRNTEIAAKLYLSEKTVKTHVNHIFTKLGATDRVQAVLYYRASIEPGSGQDTTRD